MVAKRTNYFSHDAGARNDTKVIRLRMRHGAAGYGIYFMLLERLREESDYTSVKDYDTIAFDLRVPAELVKSVVEDFDLFAFTADGERFYSTSFTARMSVKDTISRKRSEVGKLGAARREENKTRQANTPAAASKPQAIASAATSKHQAFAPESGSKETKVKKEKTTTCCCCPKEKQQEQQDGIALAEGGKAIADADRNMSLAVEAWNTLCPTLPPVKLLTPTRREKLQARLAEMGEAPLSVFADVCRHVARNSFLNGDNDSGWSASFDWLIADGNHWAKAYEEAYYSRQAAEARRRQRSAPRPLAAVIEAPKPTPALNIPKGFTPLTWYKELLRRAEAGDSEAAAMLKAPTAKA